MWDAVWSTRTFVGKTGVTSFLVFVFFPQFFLQTWSHALLLVTCIQLPCLLAPSASSSFRLDHWEGRRGGRVKRVWVGSCQMAELIIVFNYVAKLPRQLGSHQPCRQISGEECHTHINATSEVVGGARTFSKHFKVCACVSPTRCHRGKWKTLHGRTVGIIFLLKSRFSKVPLSFPVQCVFCQLCAVATELARNILGYLWSETILLSLMHLG